MKNCYVIFFVLLGMTVGAQAQKTRPMPEGPIRQTVPGGEIIAVPPIICYYTNTPTTAKPIGPPEFFLRQRRDGSKLRTEANRANILVTYSNNFPDSAKTAFEYAVGIWEAWLISPIPIRITARWANLGNGTLGSTGPKVYRNINFSGTLKANTFYVLPLAEKLARQNFNGDQSDMDMSFNSQLNWSMRTDGTAPSNRQDFVSTAVHEIAHGLGFTDSFTIDGTLGSWGEGFNIPRAYDHYVVNNQGQLLINRDAFPNPSSALSTQLRSNNIFFDSPLTRAANGGNRAKLYAPTTYRAGSQIAHLDEATYNNTPNAAMTPFGNNGEVVQNPGPITFGMFRELGWRATSVLHDRIRDTEDANQAVSFRTSLVSDTTLLAGTARLFYTVNDTAIRTNPTVVPLTRVGNTDEFTANLPASVNKRTVRYYIQVQDASGRTFSSPPEAPRFFWVFQQGPDTTPPVISHDPLTTVLQTVDSLRIRAQVTDDYEAGIDTVIVEWEVVRGTQRLQKPAFRLRLIDAFDAVYQGAVSLTGEIQGGDRINYRIVARDRSRNKNQSNNPASGFHSVQVVGLQAARDSYSNDFNAATAAADFAGNGFSITTPSGFSTPAIHSDHPYPDGDGFPNNERDLIYQLLVPINLKDQNTTIRFEEVVLVEPGEEGSIFGDTDFYDYVVVEGSRDGGKTWQPFADGYDSRDNSAWLTAYNSRVIRDPANSESQLSQAVGTPSLYRAREIDMLTSGNFTTGDQLLIRFRLHADQLSRGWGWAIDNLFIQVPKPPPVTATEPTFDATDVRVYPNPSTTGEFLLEAQFSERAGRPSVSVHTLTGQRVYAQQFDRRSTLTSRLDLSRLAAGLYLVNVDTDEGRITKRVVIAR